MPTAEEAALLSRVATGLVGSLLADDGERFVWDCCYGEGWVEAGFPKGRWITDSGRAALSRYREAHPAVKP